MRARNSLGAVVIGVAVIVGCAGALRTEAPVRHPEELSGTEAVCTECHDDTLTGALKPYSTFNHTNSFLLRHGTYARQSQDICSSCHGESLCLECHATREELSPALRRGNRPDRDLPHRGDYLVQHQIDGRVDPGSCVRCHGNRNDDRCIVCHR